MPTSVIFLSPSSNARLFSDLSHHLQSAKDHKQLPSTRPSDRRPSSSMSYGLYAGDSGYDSGYESSKETPPKQASVLPGSSSEIQHTLSDVRSEMTSQEPSTDRSGVTGSLRAPTVKVSGGFKVNSEDRRPNLRPPCNLSDPSGFVADLNMDPVSFPPRYT